ncbi:MAG TPA: hypothetical protein VF648_02955 [Pyrinomonadaceae bacterium]|jgi:hypothetical protein
MTNKKLTIISISLLSIFLIATFATLRQQAQDQSLNQQKQTDNSDLKELPIVDFAQSDLAEESSSRKKKNKRFNNRGSSDSKKMIDEFPEGVENLPTIVHWWVGLSALPLESADAVVIGTVTNRKAYLSDDKTNVYSEYEVRIEKVLKNSGESLKSNDMVALVRLGGSVRFGSGKIQKYKISQYGALQENHRYVMFLKKDNGVDLFITTGYDISGDKVIPIDGQDNKDPKNSLPFDKYLNADSNALLKDIDAVLQGYNGKGGTKQ